MMERDFRLCANDTPVPGYTQNKNCARQQWLSAKLFQALSSLLRLLILNCFAC
jgi:hypothetical protein